MLPFIHLNITLLFFTFAFPGIKISSQNVHAPTGKFVNVTVLERCPGQMPSDMPYYCFELNFNKAGSVNIDNGFEKFNLPLVQVEGGNMFKIVGASLYGDMLIKVESDSSIQLIDNAWTKLSSTSNFKKIEGPKKNDWSFVHLLNDCLFAGEYAMFKDGVLALHQVEISKKGEMKGMEPFRSYRICYAGDCLEETDPPARTIDFLDKKGNAVTFAFKHVDGKKSIEFYSLGQPLPDMKGGRSIGPMVYEWRTE